MTASDHLKDRLQPSTGGEQLRIDISNLRFYAQMAREFQWQTDVIHWSAVEATLNHLAEQMSLLQSRIQQMEEQREYLRPNLMKHFNEYRKLFGPVPLSDSYGEKWLIEKLLSAGALLENERSKAEAALAQKTRECEDARRTSEYWKAEHLAGNREIDALRVQVEQLQRQVAQWKVEYERVDGTNQTLAEECTELRRQVAEMSKPVTAKDNYPLSTLRIYESEEL